MTDAELIAELSLPAYAGKTAYEKMALLNAQKAGFNIPVIVPKATVMAIFTTAMFRISAIPEPGKTAWLQIMANIRSLDVGIKPSDAPVQQMLGQGVTDGVILPAEKAALESLGLRPGSRAEELWGEGTVVTLNDVAKVS